jgi:hypothetical protein
MKKCCDNLDEVVCASALTQEFTIHPNSWCCLTNLLKDKRVSLATFSRLKILDIRVDWLSEPQIALSDLKRLGKIKILRVTNVALLPVPPDTSFPLFLTLQEIYVEDARTKWMSGHVFMNLTTLSLVVYAGRQGFHFNAGQGRNTFPCLRTVRLLQRRSWNVSLATNWGPGKLDQLVHMIWGAAEVRKAEYEEGSFYVFCAEALPS